MANDLFDTLNTGIHDVQSGHVAEGLQEIAGVIDEVLQSDLGPFGIGLLEVREGILDIQVGQAFAVEKGIGNINVGLHDLILVATGTDYELGLNELHDGFHDILRGNTDAGFQNIYEGMQDLAVVVAQSGYYESEYQLG